VGSAGAWLRCALVLAAMLATPAQSRDQEAELWRALRSPGHLVIMRHAIAPGGGDPPGFRLGECATQRNLSADGRAQASQIGERWRRHGIKVVAVYTSQWCRARETAELLALAPVEALPLLDSFFSDAGRGEAQTADLRRWIAGRSMEGSIVLVTHQVNITALTGIFPAPGEMLVLRRAASGALSVRGRLQ
jgi:phosphohistidine phosphatase SixA